MDPRSPATRSCDERAAELAGPPLPATRRETSTMKRVTLVAALAVAVSAALATGVASSAGGSAATSSRQAALTDKAVFFAADGLRQDIVARYARQGLMPTMARFLGRGTYAAGNGLRPRRRRTPAPGGTASRPGRGPASTARPTTRSTATGSRSRTAPRPSTRVCCRRNRSRSRRSGAV